VREVSRYSTDPNEYGAKLITDFVNYGIKYTKRNPEYVRFCLHFVMGQRLRNKYFMIDGGKEDIAAPLIVLQSTGSGKTRFKPALWRISEDLGLITKDVSTITAAGLAGTSEYDPEKRKKVIVRGYLQEANVLIMDEADALFHNLQTEHYRDASIYLQKSCDSIHPQINRKGEKEKTPSHIHKKLGTGEPIDFNSNCSNFMASYIPESLNFVILHTGLIPRHITLIKHVDLEERKLVLNEIFNTINVQTPATYEEEYAEIINRLKVVTKTAGTNREQIEIEADAIEYLRDNSIEMANMITECSMTARELLEGFVVRYALFPLRLAIHRALLSLRKSVNVNDAAYGSMIMRPVWQKLISYLELSVVQDPRERALLNNRVHSSLLIYKALIKKGEKGIEVRKGGWVRENSLIDRCKGLDCWFDCSGTAARDYFIKLTKKENESNPKAWFDRKKIGNTAYIRAIRDLVT